MKTIITFGTYDLLHVGHVRLLSRAKELGDRLVVGVSSDSLNFSKKINTLNSLSRREWKLLA
jgi:cytidyltransferase-like protein